MRDFLWTLFWVLLLAIYFAPKEITYTMDGVTHHFKWSTQSNDEASK